MTGGPLAPWGRPLASKDVRDSTTQRPCWGPQRPHRRHQGLILQAAPKAQDTEGLEILEIRVVE